MAWNNPSVADFKSRFTRDFPFGTDPNLAILDVDIANAFQEVNIQINQSLFLSQASYAIGYLYFTAHVLATNMVNSSQGINGQGNDLQASKSVGGVSESFSIPQRILDNPFFAGLAKTTYGRKYIYLVLPNLTGPMTTVFGQTKP